MPLTYRLVAVLAAVAAAVTVPGSPAATDEPRNPVAEAATGDTEAMVAVVQVFVDCLRSKGFDPGAPEVRGENVVVTDWHPAWDSPAGRADRTCFFAMP